MLEQLLQYDTDLFLFLNNLGSPSWDGFWMFYTTKFNWVPFYAVLLFLMFKKRNDKRFVFTVLVIAAMIAFTDQVTNLFKHGFERPRPCHEAALIDIMRIVKKGCGGAFGYFSGHASNSMATAVFVGLLLRYKYRYAIYILIVWAVAMAYSRVYVGVHYPIDIASGMLFGAVTGYAFYRLENYLNTRFKPTN